MIALPISENVSFLKYQLSLYRYSIAQETGLLKVEKVSLDGTKVKANASKHKALSYGHIKKLGLKTMLCPKRLHTIIR